MADPNHRIPTILREAGLVEWTRAEFMAYPVEGANIGVSYNQMHADDSECQFLLDWVYSMGRKPTGFHLFSVGTDDVNDVHIALK